MDRPGETRKEASPTRCGGGGIQPVVLSVLGLVLGLAAGIAYFDHGPGVELASIVLALAGAFAAPIADARTGAVVTIRKWRKIPARLFAPIRVARIFYAILSSVFAAGVVVQVFFAGMGAFGADWSWHRTFVHVLEPLPLLMIPVAFLGRLSWGLRLLPFGLLVLIGAQYAFAGVAVPAAALHPVNALLIFFISFFMARQAWSSVAEQRKG